jgi:hypothetical protein
MAQTTHDINEMLSDGRKIIEEIDKTVNEIIQICTTKSPACISHIGIHLENEHLVDIFNKEFENLDRRSDNFNEIDMPLFNMLRILHKKLNVAWEKAKRDVDDVKRNLGI